MTPPSPPLAMLCQVFNSFTAPKKEHGPMETQTQVSPKSSLSEHSRKMTALLRGALDFLEGDEREFLTPIALDYARRHPADFEKVVRASYKELIDGEVEECLE